MVHALRPPSLPQHDDTSRTDQNTDTLEPNKYKRGWRLLEMSNHWSLYWPYWGSRFASLWQFHIAEKDTLIENSYYTDWPTAKHRSNSWWNLSTSIEIHKVWFLVVRTKRAWEYQNTTENHFPMRNLDLSCTTIVVVVIIANKKHHGLPVQIHLGSSDGMFSPHPSQMLTASLCGLNPPPATPRQQLH